MTLGDLKTGKVAVLGMGVNHEALAKYLQKQGVSFQVIDGWKTDAELAERLSGFDIIFRTPGVPFFSKSIQTLKRRGAKIYSQTKLFFDLCQAPIIGVTGTKGKGTTSTLIFKILEAAALRQAHGRKVYLAGNIGRDPFEFIDKLTPNDFVILELSSFQLQDLHKSPHIAVVLKITPEHLDHHQDLAEYIEAKTSIVRFQSASDFAVLSYDSESTRTFAGKTKARIVWNSIKQEVKPGCYATDRKIFLNGEIVAKTAEVALLGRFNLENVTAAIAAAAAAGVTDGTTIKKAISEFRGLPHRLEFIAEIGKVKFYNDSFATTPETTVAALTAFADPIVLIAGGSEKKSDYAELGKKIAESKVKTLIAIGVTGPKIAKLARDAGFAGKIFDTGLNDMEQIIAKANEAADPGDVVLLSPASASFDMFDNYKQRGELFSKFVSKLAK
ncbi:MAG: UDP-N-acetylmuramoylalanine--D-glutamate ligase [Candidatus Doudnabacteria bacterium RIFCSPHIGHO2_02_FULL_48_21]|nr:MAG: UDP-N-acetylmuramoylalanine--D-glutamate ligase [Candidatus Doudnabacteria bacterium RIFCSPHIGHO2_01_48_18]OGE79574.1 MAG: UDP-N-acetylmuramoylalanine--D-glutamate ligase [Candidatus Doudnabacteria bacterium RIFCSPHIGHO2_01_FULL_48_180]OGE91101.1 MAG: UDP-N-acetylmuramoylalanine--D-glutamate ligase [Candidatus Doudnabacteria bacterium RIFCSPHIGHO2_12_FULL_47_25]OGE93791.1 MAG: UDP-N-acetylmuramoylalanine--D-glutamate ligase [Candidatus Doudnabacteria bacterium RIFCSPHIGHO2_02_FULL_48_21]